MCEEVSVIEVLSYKGYYGTIEFSEADDCWCGRLLVDDCILYEAASKVELRGAFKDALVDYLITLVQIGKVPAQQPYEGDKQRAVKPNENH